MEPRFGSDGHLAARRAAVVCSEQHYGDAELLDRIERNGQPHKRLLRLVNNIGGVDAIESEVVVIEAATGKAYAAWSLLVSTAPGASAAQRRPVAAVQWQLLHLLFSFCGNSTPRAF